MIAWNEHLAVFGNQLLLFVLTDTGFNTYLRGGAYRWNGLYYFPNV